MSKSKITDTTIEALTRNFYKESQKYGFSYEDYLKFVNFLLDFAITQKQQDSEGEAPRKKNIYDQIITELPIKTDRIAIREFDKVNDRILFEKWSEDKSGRHFLLSSITAHYISVNELLSDKKHKLGTITLLDGTPIGLMGFLNWDSTQGKAELRKLIASEEFRGRGYAKEAAKLWINYGKTILQLKKIYLHTLDTNIRNIRLNEELGFAVEGILRNEIKIDGEYQDVLRMGILFE